MSTMPNTPESGVPAPKKTSPIVWILAGVGGFIMLCMVGCGVVFYMGMHKLKEAGFDSELMQKNPGMAMTKMMAALIPNAEIVSTNDRNGTVTIRDKETGKTVTYKFDSDKKTMVVTGENGEEVKFGGNSAAQMPSWVPVYPGSSPEGTYSIKSNEGSAGNFTFKTSDAPSKVTSYYQDQLRSSGFNVTLVSSGDQSGMLSAEDADKKRSITITTGATDGTTTTSVMVNEKK